MKLFQKIKKQNGRRHIYFCGIKIFSYKRKKHPDKTAILCLDHYPNNCCVIPDYDNYIKRGIIFPHLIGVIIRRHAIIGNNCRIYQNVTIGLKSYQDERSDKKDSPIIGDNTVIYAGAVIVGPVKVGKNCVIGANSLVIHDIPDNCVAGGIPARVIKKSPPNK